MTKLVFGLVLWWGGHLWKRLIPSLHARLGGGAKAISSFLILAGLVLLVLGYQAVPIEPVYNPPTWGQHANNLLMLLAMISVGLAHSKGAIAARIGHPFLTATMLWAIAHLLVRGDLASLVLFGGIGLWALVERVILTGRGVRQKGGARRDLVGMAAGVILFAIVAYVHGMIGPSPFPA